VVFGISVGRARTNGPRSRVGLYKRRWARAFWPSLGMEVYVGTEVLSF